MVGVFLLSFYFSFSLSLAICFRGGREQSLEGTRIFVVDDNELLAWMPTNLLESSGAVGM